MECRLNGAVAGIRYFYETGELESEFPLKDGVTHGFVDQQMYRQSPFFDRTMLKC